MNNVEKLSKKSKLQERNSKIDNKNMGMISESSDNNHHDDNSDDDAKSRVYKDAVARLNLTTNQTNDNIDNSININNDGDDNYHHHIDSDENDESKHANIDKSKKISKRKILYYKDILKMDPVQYNNWIDSIDARSEKVQIFENPKIDAIVTQMSTKYHFIGWFIFWISIIIYLLPWNLNGSVFFLIWVGYSYLWKIIECFVHKYVFHMQVVSTIQMKIHFTFHGLHHAAPKDLNHLMLPPIAGSIIAIIIYSILRITLGVPDIASSLMIGILIGYIQYDITHYCIHAFSKKQFVKFISQFILPNDMITSLTKKFSKLKSNHDIHHYNDHTQYYNVSFE